MLANSIFSDYLIWQPLTVAAVSLITGLLLGYALWGWASSRVREVESSAEELRREVERLREKQERMKFRLSDA